MKNENLKIAVIGLGGRGKGLLSLVMYRMKDVDVVAVCDLYEDRVADARKLAKKMRRAEPKGYTDYKELLTEKLDGVVITASWSAHLQIAKDFMKAGIPCGVEVGGAYDIAECREIVRCYEETKTPYMMLENCCYGEYELAVLKMVREGLFGEVVHCGGGYKHNIRDEIAFGEKNRHYRLHEYLTRNCDNYPTHEIGPISKILNITYGNRFVSLTSTASKARGMKYYVGSRAEKYPELRSLTEKEFLQGDIVTTVIKCANGETVTITLDTTLPRVYSRGFLVQGTKAMFSEDEKRLVMDGKDKCSTKVRGLFYTRTKYEHPIWKRFKRSGIRGGHGGMDWLVLSAYFSALRTEEKYMPIDVYEAATWMAITALSAESIRQGGMPVEFPDFTDGKWQTRRQKGKGMFYLEKTDD